jgi:tetratricopeptide (TPR) repeat protein
VVAALLTVPDAERDAEWKPLLRRTLIMQGKEHHRNQEWRAAFESLTRAAPLFPDGKLPPALIELAADSGARAAGELLRTGENDEQRAVDLLEAAASVAPDSTELRADLASAYARLAQKTSDETTDHVIALAQIRKALVLAPDAPMVRLVLESVAAKRARQLTRPGPDASLLEAAELWRELIDVEPGQGYQAGLSRTLLLLARSAALAGDKELALGRAAEALLADPKWSGDAAQEAPGRVAILVANHVTENLSHRPFDERADLLRTARTYCDFPELRVLMLAVWRSEAVIDFDARRYTRCAMLLEEALTISGDAQDTAHLHGELAVVYSADAVRAANQRQRLQARALITLALVHAPGDPEMLELQAQINATR